MALPVQECLQELADLIQIQEVVLHQADTTPTDTSLEEADMIQNCIQDTTRKLYKSLQCRTGDLTLTLNY